MKKIVFTKIVLMFFLGSFQNVLSQSKKIDEINQSISYWENEYSYDDYLSSYDRSICARSLGGRGSIYSFSKIGDRKYNVVFINLVNSDMSEITVDYSNKPVPSETEYKNYITDKINSLKEGIKSENERLLVIEKRRLANVEFKKKRKVYIEKEQDKLLIRLDSILNDIGEAVENTNSYYGTFKFLDSLFKNDYDYFQIKKDSLFELPIKYIEEIFGKSYDYEALNVLPFYRDADYSIEEHLSNGLRGYLDRNDNEIRQIDLRGAPSINTLLKVSDIYYKLNSDGLSEEYLKIGESIKRYLLFFNSIDSNRWVNIININSDYFNYRDVDTTGLKFTREFKWNDGKKDSSVISDLFKWYEVEKDLIFKEGFNYDKLTDRPDVRINNSNYGKTYYERMIEDPEKFEQQLLITKQRNKWRDKIPPYYILKKIYLQYGEINGFFDYFNDLGYIDFASQEDFYTDKLIQDLSILSGLRERINIIKEFDKFIIEDLKPLFVEVRNGKDLVPVKRKIYRKIHSEIIENLSEKEKVIHYSLVGDYVDYSLNSEVKFFYSLLHYGHRNKEFRSGSVSNISNRYSEFPPETFKFKNLKEFFVFIDDNNINHDDLMAYINKTRKIISNYK